MFDMAWGDTLKWLLTTKHQGCFRQLQLIQNAAARILTRTNTLHDITLVLRSLHWLPVCQRIDFNILLLVYKALTGFGPKYISDLLPQSEPSRPRRSSGTGLILVPRVRTKHGESVQLLCTKYLKQTDSPRLNQGVPQPFTDAIPRLWMGLLL